MASPDIDDLFKEAGALGVYSYYYQANRDNFHEIRLRSPIKSPGRLTPTPVRSTGPRTPVVQQAPVALASAPLASSPPPPLPQVAPIDHLNHCLNTIVGKDKSSKIIIYLLRLLTSLPTSFSSPLLRQLFLRSQGIIKGLGLYRQILRSLGVPFHLVRLTRMIRSSAIIVNNSKLGTPIRTKQLLNYWFNWDVITYLSSFYYAWADESLLLYNLGVLQNHELSHYHKLCSKHELLAWFAITVVGLRNDFAKYDDLLNRENAIKINFQVKERAHRLLSLSSGSPSTITKFATAYSSQLAEISKEKRILMVDIVRLSSDLIYDSVYVFHRPMYQPLHLSLGLASGILGFYKLWLSY
ncbi:hypothetical protein FOA43_002080 [Brettanomyces nanus]|uniref:Uncharacterized protein n=1 Tax=Eeniella nana TaxID=13502 RepID=A0A875RUM8_EENNA|nr:uncharacterized protein FOA43_002080 [Brettanomyces nanus]QPG74747.1 hypothetical protein FOA43_002080 [Brettanomyces nanus]